MDSKSLDILKNDHIDLWSNFKSINSINHLETHTHRDARVHMRTKATGSILLLFLLHESAKKFLIRR